MTLKNLLEDMEKTHFVTIRNTMFDQLNTYTLLLADRAKIIAELSAYHTEQQNTAATVSEDELKQLSEIVTFVENTKGKSARRVPDAIQKQYEHAKDVITHHTQLQDAKARLGPVANIEGVMSIDGVVRVTLPIYDADKKPAIETLNMESVNKEIYPLPFALYANVANAIRTEFNEELINKTLTVASVAEGKFASILLTSKNSDLSIPRIEKRLTRTLEAMTIPELEKAHVKLNFFKDEKGHLIDALQEKAYHTFQEVDTLFGFKSVQERASFTRTNNIKSFRRDDNICCYDRDVIDNLFAKKNTDYSVHEAAEKLVSLLKKYEKKVRTMNSTSGSVNQLCKNGIIKFYKTDKMYLDRKEFDAYLDREITLLSLDSGEKKYTKGILFETAAGFLKTTKDGVKQMISEGTIDKGKGDKASYVSVKRFLRKNLYVNNTWRPYGAGH
ncbi:MAG: hypothetical protein WC916_00960 [Candidatus Woesearchaeota archaeon]